MAGCKTSISSRPNNPPSPAWGLTPATAMRGLRLSKADKADWVMRKVSRTRSTVIASSASRMETWMLTSTVRNSLLASIMRTGICASVTPAYRADSACSNSVWPGYWSYGAPAACKASLCKGAVTSAATSPLKAARVAHSTASPANCPARPSTWPHGISGRTGTTCSTGKHLGGTTRACAGVSISQTG